MRFLIIGIQEHAKQCANKIVKLFDDLTVIFRQIRKRNSQYSAIVQDQRKIVTQERTRIKATE